MKGLFITLEGIDSCGKSEQTRLLVEKLQSEHYPVIVIRDPGTNPISEKIREILLSTKNHNLCRETELLLFAAARAQMVAETILPELADGKIVVCDRFYDSTTAYQGFGRKIDLEIIARLNAFASRQRAPDVTFIVDISPKEALNRQKQAQKKLDRIEQEATEFRAAVRHGFHYIAKHEPKRVILINGEDSIEHIAAKIWQQVKLKIDRL